MKYILWIIAFVIVGYLFTIFETKRKQKKIENTFKGRELLSPEAFYEKFYRDKDIAIETVKGVRKVLEEQLDCDLSQLSSEDDFSENLSFFWDFDSMASVEIVMALEEEFSVKIEDSEAEKAHTINDIIMLVSSKVKNA